MRCIKWAVAVLAAVSMLFVGFSPASAHGGESKEGKPCPTEDGGEGTWEKVPGKHYKKTYECVPNEEEPPADEPDNPNNPNNPGDEPNEPENNPDNPGNPEDEPENNPDNPGDDNPGEPVVAVAVVAEPEFTG